MNINALLFCSKCLKKDPDTDYDRLICKVCHFADHRNCYNDEKNQFDFMCQACIKNHAANVLQQRQIDAFTLPYDDPLSDDKDFEWKYNGRGRNARMGFSRTKKERPMSTMFTPKIMTVQIMEEVFRVQTETPYDTVRDLKNAFIYHFDDANKMLVRGSDGNAVRDNVLLTDIIDGSEMSF